MNGKSWRASALGASCLALMAILGPLALAADTPATEDPVASEPIEGLALVRADTLTYDPQAEVVTASGNVEIDYRTEHLSADRVTYDQKADRVTADGNIVMIDKEGNVLFADHLELRDQLREGVIEKVGILFGKTGRIAARGAVRHKGTATVMAKAVYSPCNLCKDDPNRAPLWQFKARRITHDKEDQEVYYRDAIFELYGVPIFYTPYYEHPDPNVKRKSGFLSPSFGTSSTFGTFVTIPYYWAISDSYDATITPTFTAKEGLALRGEYRQLLRRGGFELDGSITRPDELDDTNQPTGRKDLRGHLFANGRFTLSPVWQTGFQIQQTTDDTYLRRYKISGLDRLENRLFVEGIEGRNYLAANAYSFEDLRANDIPGQTPLVAPVLEGAYTVLPSIVGGRAIFSGNFLSLTRTSGIDMRRLSGGLDWQRQITFGGGLVATSFAAVRGDLYVTNDVNIADTPYGPDNSTTTGRVLPQTGLDLRWAFVRPFSGFTHLVEPIVQIVYAPNGGNSADIPNEDSVSFEFDESNLFARNRFPGLDRWEDGARVNYGIRTAAFWGKSGFAEVLVGQSHRFSDESPFPTGSGLDTKNSDYVGHIVIRPSGFLEFSHRFRLNKDDFAYKRNETSISASIWRATGSVGYTSVTSSDVSALSTSLKALLASLSVKISNRWQFAAATQRDITNNRTVFRQAGLSYENECILLGLVYRQDYTTDRDVTPTSSVVLQIRLVN